MGRLILIRHSKVEPANPGAFVGSYDIELSPDGAKEARDMEFSLPGDFRLWSSPQKRARQTASLLFPDREPRTDLRLREIDFGRWENRTFEQIRQENPEEVESWVKAPREFAFPDGESVPDFIARVEEVAADLVQSAESQTTVAVTHGGVIRFMLCHLIGLPYEHHLALRCDRPSVNVVDLHDGFATLSGLNLEGYSGQRL